MSVLTVLLSGAPAVPGTPAAARRHARWLWCALFLFVFRVVAQPLSALVNVPFLPPFEAWYSGAVPYWVLLPAQLLIVVVLASMARSVSSGDVTPRPRLGTLLLVVGGIYFAVMLARLALGATLLSDQRWFAKPVPTIFHLVLASSLLVYGHFHARYGS